MCFLDITVQSPESTGHISLNQPKKRLSSPSPLLLKGLPCPSLSSPLITPLQPRNSLYPIAMKYTKTKWKSTSSCKIGIIEFMSCFHSNTPGKHSVSFALWGKHTPAVLTFTKNLHWALILEVWISPCHWHPNIQTSSKPKILKTTTLRNHSAKQIKKKFKYGTSSLKVFFNQAPKD